MMKRAAIFLASALFVCACDRPPVAGYVTVPKPPATAENDMGAAYELEVASSTATAVVFLAYDPSEFSGDTPASDARSLDDSIVRVERATSERTIHYGSPDYTGRVFVLYGVRPGNTSIEVFNDGESAGIIPVTVVRQDP
jgi:hypothetical protein